MSASQILLFIRRVVKSAPGWKAPGPETALQGEKESEAGLAELGVEASISAVPTVVSDGQGVS